MPSRSCRTRPDDRDGRTCTAAVQSCVDRPAPGLPQAFARSGARAGATCSRTGPSQPENHEFRIRCGAETSSAPSAGWVARGRHRTLATRPASRWSRPLPPLGVTHAIHCRTAPPGKRVRRQPDTRCGAIRPPNHHPEGPSVLGEAQRGPFCTRRGPGVPVERLGPTPARGPFYQVRAQMTPQ
jgi:hypothetical protein